MKNHFYISFGIWVAIVPFLGIPSVWRNGVLAASGILLVAFELAPVAFKKLKTKPKTVKRKNKVESGVVTSVAGPIESPFSNMVRDSNLAEEVKK